MLSPLGVAALPWYWHLAAGLIVIALGCLTFVLIGLILDSSATRHMLHWMRFSGSCGRCAQERLIKEEAKHGRWVRARQGAGPVAAAINRDGRNA